jgi:dimeric dUTPase (all-alpha-NTP-PPase superfamily)
MNLEKLFQTQKVLRDRIGYNEPDRFNKLILALLVELGECANEQRSWKFWSKNQQPRVKQARAPYMDLDDADFYNPLLEEFVDGLHFVLDIGIELKKLGILNNLPNIHRTKIKEKTLLSQFKEAMRCALMVERTYIFDSSLTEHAYKNLLDIYIGLGEMLGFTWEEVEQAYFAKNAINHARQESGY